MSERSQEIELPSLSLVAVVGAIRGGRALLGWSQKELAAQAGVSVPALNRLERLDSEPQMATVVRLQDCLYEAGVSMQIGHHGELSLEVQPRVVEGIRDRLRRGAAVTSRGRVGKRGKPSSPPDD